MATTVVVVPANAGGVLLLPMVAAAAIVGVTAGALPVARGLAIARALMVAIVTGGVTGTIERRLLLDRGDVLELRLT
jgi:hypothetical protein